MAERQAGKGSDGSAAAQNQDAASVCGEAATPRVGSVGHTCDVNATENSRMTEETRLSDSCVQNPTQPPRRVALVARVRALRAASPISPAFQSAKRGKGRENMVTERGRDGRGWRNVGRWHGKIWECMGIRRWKQNSTSEQISRAAANNRLPMPNACNMPLAQQSSIRLLRPNAQCTHHALGAAEQHQATASPKPPCAALKCSDTHKLSHAMASWQFLNVPRQPLHPWCMCIRDRDVSALRPGSERLQPGCECCAICG
eukprot:357048-Chlamydomonas_euryale.AAC.5